MPKSFPLQNSFAAGEIDEEMQDRNDLEGFKYALSFCENFIPSRQGTLNKRIGSKFLYEIVGSTYGKVFSFQIDARTIFYVTMTPEEIVIGDPNGQIISNELVLNYTFNQFGDNWFTIISSIVVPADTRPTITFVNGVCISLIPAAFSIPPGQDVHQDVTVANQVNNHRFTVNLAGHIDPSDPATRQHNGDVFIRVKDPSDDSILFEQIAPILEGGQQYEYTLDFVPSIPVVRLSVRVSDPGSIVNGIEIQRMSLYDSTVSTDITFVSPYTISELKELQNEAAPDRNAMYFTVRDKDIYKLGYDAQANLWSFGVAPFTFGAAPNPPWDLSVDGYRPSALTFHQGRLYLAGTSERNATVWASKPAIGPANNYEDFDAGAGSNPDDALEFTLAQKGDIQWMNGGKVLIIGTESSETAVNPDGTIIEPGNINAPRNTSFGSARVKSKPISDQVAYIGRGGSKVWATNYNDVQKNLEAEQINFSSESLSFGIINEFHHVTLPDNRLYFVLENGNLSICIYEKGVGIVGWTRFKTNGKVLSISPAIIGNTLRFWAIVIRNEKLLFEIFESQIFMDSYVDNTYENPTSIITGLDHLEGLEVNVLVDGAIVPNKTVNSGQITLDSPGTSVIVGLNYIANMTTLPVISLLEYGSTISAKKSHNAIYIKVLASTLPTINGQNPRRRSTSTPMGQREPNKTEIVRVMDLGWDEEALIDVVHDVPLDCRIISIFSEETEEQF